MGERLSGKVALITGGTSGIGEATVRRFLAEGAQVVFTGRAEDKGRTLERELGPDALFFCADSLHEQQIEEAIGFTTDAFGRLDCLFNNAGAGTAGELATVTQAEFDHAMRLLLGSVVFGIKHALPVMQAQGGGSIINNSSVAALRAGMGQLLYSAAKAAVTQVTRVAGMSLGPLGIRVNCISPGGIATPIFFGGSAASRMMPEETGDALLERLRQGLAARLPLRRAGVPDDIAWGAVYLASDEASFVTGQDLVIDGGLITGDPDLLPGLIGEMLGES